METPLAEYVALACYTAKERFGKRFIHQGVLEKMLVCTTGFPGPQIEGLEKYYHHRGEQNRLHVHRIAIERIPGLLDLRTKYYDRISQGQKILFQCTDKFTQDLPNLNRKSYLGEYEQWIHQLLEIWQSKLGFEGLLYLSMLSDRSAGTMAVVADIELMVEEIEKYIWTNVKSRSKRKLDKKNFLKRLREPYTSLRQKISILEKSKEYEEELRKICKSLVGLKILENARCFSGDSYVWQLTKWLGDRLMEIAEIISSWPLKETPLFEPTLDKEKTEIIKRVESSMSRVMEITGWHLEVDEEDLSEKLSSMFDIFEKYIDLWNRTLTAKYDPRFFELHSPRETVYEIRKCIVYYDVRESTKAIVAASKEHSLWIVYNEWLDKMTAIAKNWSILFEAYVSSLREEAGDKIKSLFDHASDGVYSMALILNHFDLIDSVRDKSIPFRTRANGGIGLGEIQVKDGKEHSLVINQCAHAVSKVVDLDPEGTSGFYLSEFLKEYPHFERFIIGKVIVFPEGQARMLDYNAVVKDFTRRLSDNSKV